MFYFPTIVWLRTVSVVKTHDENVPSGFYSTNLHVVPVSPFLLERSTASSLNTKRTLYYNSTETPLSPLRC